MTFDALTPREMDMLVLLAGSETLGIKQAADRLGIAFRTATKHVDNIHLKTGLRTMAALVRAWTLHEVARGQVDLVHSIGDVGAGRAQAHPGGTHGVVRRTTAAH